jgi:hypothetical protein
MNDDDDPLRGYRPFGPPQDLRARIVREAGRTPAAGIREWLPALATAALILLCYGYASSTRARVQSAIAEVVER